MDLHEKKVKKKRINDYVNVNSTTTGLKKTNIKTDLYGNVSDNPVKSNVIISRVIYGEFKNLDMLVDNILRNAFFDQRVSSILKLNSVQQIQNNEKSHESCKISDELGRTKKNQLANPMRDNYRTKSGFLRIITLNKELEDQIKCIKRLGYSSRKKSNITHLYCGFKGCLMETRSRHMMCKHIKTHCNIKPFKCPICSDSFIRKDLAKSHLTNCIGKVVLNV